MHSSTAVPEWWSNEAKTPIWRRQINKRISCFRLRWLFRAAQRGLGRICFGGPLLSRPWGCMGLCDCSFGGHQVLLSSTESLGGVPNKSLGLALVVTLRRRSMRDSPRSPTVKTNGSRFEGNRIINPHSPDSKVNKQTNKQTDVSEKTNYDDFSSSLRKQRNTRSIDSVDVPSQKTPWSDLTSRGGLH